MKNKKWMFSIKKKSKCKKFEGIFFTCKWLPENSM